MTRKKVFFAPLFSGVGWMTICSFESKTAYQKLETISKRLCSVCNLFLIYFRMMLYYGCRADSHPPQLKNCLRV